MLRFAVALALLVTASWSVGQSNSPLAVQELISSSNIVPATFTVHVPLVIKFSGVLKPNVDPSPLPTTVQGTFTIFKDQEGGAPLWLEEQTIHLDRMGRYSAGLGSTSPEGVPIDIFLAGDARWLEVTADGYVQTARTPLLSVPYALKASDADTLNGRAVSSFILADQLPSLMQGMGIVPAINSSAKPGQSPVASFPQASADVADSVHSQVNKFSKRQFFLGGLTLPPLSDAPKNSVTGISSSTFDLIASAFNSSAKSAQGEHFRWQADAVNSNSDNPSGQLSLLFGARGSKPKPTGFSFNADGTVNFAPQQIVPLNAIQNALADAGLSVPTGGSPGGPPIPPVVDTGRYSWQQTPGGKNAIQVGANTVTLTPCPKGVNGTDLWHYLYISGAGTPEAVLITGGDCVGGMSKGTVTFSAAYPHPATYQIGSATAGVQEAFNDAITPKSDSQNSRSVLITPGDYLFHARLSIRASSVNVSVSGATITCAMQDTCIFLGDPGSSNTFQSITIDGLRVRPGIPRGTWTAVEDNAGGSTISNMGTASNASPGNSFGHLVQNDNDQAEQLIRVNTNLGNWSRCDTTFCSSAIYGPGPPDTNAGVFWISNSNLTFQCGANGIDNLDGNTLHVSDSVVQGYAQFGVRSYALYANVPSVLFNNVYEEIGNCTNPLGTGIAGLIVLGGFAEVSGGTGPVGSVPQYVNTGNTQYNYYVVVHSSTLGDSPVFVVGTALTNGAGKIPVLWNQIGRQGVITYDLLRTSGAGDSTPFGTGAFAVAIGLTSANCSNQVCSFVDDASSTPSSYTVPNATYSPTLRNWPGSVILTQIGDTMNNKEGAARYFTQTWSGGGFVSSSGTAEPSVFAGDCSSARNGSPVWMQCQRGNPSSDATLFDISTGYGVFPGLKGRVIFEGPADYTDLVGTEVVTFADSNPAKTMAASGNRPTWDAADTFAAFDMPNGSDVAHVQFSFGAPVSLSNYINHVPDGVAWLERLYANVKLFRVPITAPSYETASNCVSAVGTCDSASAGIVSIAPGSTTITVFTTAVNALSEIHTDENLTYGGPLGVLCDPTFGRQYRIVGLTPGVGFTIETNTAPLASACLSYSFTN
jgi:hypothetical protein